MMLDGFIHLYNINQNLILKWKGQKNKGFLVFIYMSWFV